MHLSFLSFLSFLSLSFYPLTNHFMDYIGIDVSKNSHTACVLSPDDQRKYFTFENTEKDFNKFWKQLPKNEKTFGVESTGFYHQKIVKFFLKKKSKVKIINPIMTKQFTRATVRKSKTDLKDSLIIARLLTQNAGYYVDKNSIDNPIKTLTRGRLKLVHIRASLKNSQHMNNNKILKNYFSSLITYFDGKIKKCAEEINKFQSPQLKNLTTMVGVSDLLGNTIISESGDVNRFKSSKSYVAYCGFDPKIRQSGRSINSHGSITKRGSPYLRNALFLAARVAARYDPEIKAYYEKKRNEGKPYKVAMCAVTRKFAIRAYTILKQNRPYAIANI